MRWIYLHADSHSDSELHLRGILTDSECMDGDETIIQPTVVLYLHIVPYRYGSTGSGHVIDDIQTHKVHRS